MSLFSCTFPAEFASLLYPGWKKSRYHFSEETSGPRQVRITSVGVQQIWKEWIPPVFMNMLCLIAISSETDESSSITYVWKKSQLTITSLMKKRENCNCLLTAGMLSFQWFCVLQAVESWHRKSCGIWFGVCVCLCDCVCVCAYVHACATP